MAGHQHNPLFLGIDAGTGGVRALVVDATGRWIARATSAYAARVAPDLPPGRHEQQPAAWQTALTTVTSTLMEELRRLGVAPERLQALAIDGTSGTLVCLDRAGQPLRAALMYNDARADVEAVELEAVVPPGRPRLGLRFTSSFALAKILWLRRHEPAVFESTAHFAHHADFLVALLTSDFGISDYSNALKTGYDLLAETWPDLLRAWNGVRERLPRVVAPGTPIGRVSATGAAATGLPAGLAVVAGCSDGTAGFLASGVRRPGDYNTSLGTTLIFKTMADSPCEDPQGRIYCHKLPHGTWLPGAASNTGAEWTRAACAGSDPRTLDRDAERHLPTPWLAYPLARRGERFPFVSENAEGFLDPATPPAAAYAARLQGTALIERLAYDVLDSITGRRGGEVYSTGAASASDVWMQCRADVTGRAVHRPATAEAALGAAVLAAAGAGVGSLEQALATMTRVERTFTPRADHHARHSETFARFTDELRRRGFLA